MGRLHRVILVLVLYTTLPLSACVWCDTNPGTQQPIPALTQLYLESRDAFYQSGLLDGATLSLVDKRVKKEKPAHFKDDVESPADLPTHFSYLEAREDEPTCRFYTEYLENYYPFAQTIIWKLLPTMCPKAVQEALCALVYLMHERPWRYFVNDKDTLRFEFMHVEIFYKQLNELVGALERTTVDWLTGLVETYGSSRAKPSYTLIQLWREQGQERFYEFYAFYADTIVRLDYLGIRFENYVQSYTYCDRQKYSLRFLRDSPYEQTYTQTLRLYGDLLKMLRQRLWGGV